MHTESLLRLVFLRSQVASSVIDDPTFWGGFIIGLIFAFLVGFISQRVLFLLRPIVSFFEPIKKPITQSTPSPAALLGGCVRQLILMGFLVFVLVILVIILL
jgi:hypothetical protein